ncbi:MAG: hypothetical protein MJ221_03430 [Bacilli bacterium]|nr:hypothetical protein [Bacilli bacterium]
MDKYNGKYLAAAIIVKGKYVILRSAFKEDYEQYGCYFPGCKKLKSVSDAKQLTKQLYLKYKLRVVVVGDFLGDVFIKLKKEKTATLYLYKCLLRNDSGLDSDDVIAKLYSPSELSKLKFDVADGYLAQRIMHFHRVYECERKTKTLPLSSQRKILLFYNCLLHYSKKVATQDLIDFAKLQSTNASFNEIRDAFLWIINRSKVSFEKYIKYVNRRKK